MPIWLRNFTFNKLKEYYDAEQAAANKDPNKIDLTNPDKSTPPQKRPSHSPPSYVTKVSRK
jgi:hypothetical protein